VTQVWEHGFGQAICELSIGKTISLGVQKETKANAGYSKRNRISCVQQNNIEPLLSQPDLSCRVLVLGALFVCVCVGRGAILFFTSMMRSTSASVKAWGRPTFFMECLWLNKTLYMQEGAWLYIFAISGQP
jgi:hypothetical protein